MNINQNISENSRFMIICIIIIFVLLLFILICYNGEHQNKIVENFDSIVQNNKNNITNSQKICMQSAQNMNNNYANMAIVNNDWKKSLSCNPNSNFALCDNNNTNSYDFRLPPLNMDCDRCQTRQDNSCDICQTNKEKKCGCHQNKNCQKEPKSTCDMKKNCEKKNSCPIKNIDNINSSCYMANNYDMKNNCYDLNDCGIKSVYENKCNLNKCNDLEKCNYCKNNIPKLKKECFGGDIGNIIPQILNNTHECIFSSTPNKLTDKLYSDVTTYNNDIDPNGETGVIKCAKECDGSCVEYGETGVAHCYHPYKEKQKKLNGGISYFSDNDVSRPQQLIFPDLR